MNDSLTASILTACRAHGFVAAGVADAGPTEWGDALRAWIAAGRHGEMAYLERHLDILLDPNRLLPGARSIVCVADRYHDGSPDDPPVSGAPVGGRIARYARGRDYHRVIRKRLFALCDELRRAHPDAAFRSCVDTAPLLEREYAQRAGIGAVGKNTLLIQRGLGSYVLLGEIVTTLELVPSAPAPADPCGACTRCIDACPTDAITPWSVDATRCISYLTIEHRSEVAADLEGRVDDWIFGCDVCQEVCPHNEPTDRARSIIGDMPRSETDRGPGEVRAAYAPRRVRLDVLDVMGWSEEDRRDAFTTSSMKRARLAMMKRNALLVAASALVREEDGGLRRRIEEIAADASEDEMVRATARRAIASLGTP